MKDFRKTISKQSSYQGLFILLFAALLIFLLCSVALGRYPISIKELFGILFSRLFDIEAFWTPVQESLLLQHRLPRVILACLVGCSLSAAGAAYQGVFQNPMAAPDILGASSGAAFGAALAILLRLSGAMIIAFAFISSIITVFFVILTGSRTRGKRVLGLVLSGIMISSLMSSGTSFIKLVADPEDQLPAISYWLMGSLNGSSPRDVLLALIPMLIGLIPMYLLRWRINVLTLDDDEARTLGLNSERIRVVVIVCATLLTAASVAVSGVIGWIGLVVPNLCRKLVGNDYRRLLPISMLSGALFLLIVDNVSRSLLASEIPIGILTSFIGAPFFIYLMSVEGERR